MTDNINSWMDDYVENSPPIQLAKSEEDAQQKELALKVEQLESLIKIAKRMYEGMDLMQQNARELQRTSDQYRNEEDWMKWQTEFANFPTDQEIDRNMVFDVESNIDRYNPRVKIHENDRLWTDLDIATKQLEEHLATLVTKASIWLDNKKKHFEIRSTQSNDAPF